MKPCLRNKEKKGLKKKKKEQKEREKSLKPSEVEEADF